MSFFEKYCVDPNIKYQLKFASDYYNDKKYGIVGNRGDKKGKNPNGWTHHMTIGKIKSKLDPSTFNSYLKFCVIRNPYDKMVSMYFYQKNRGRTTKSFKEFAKNKKLPIYLTIV